MHRHTIGAGIAAALSLVVGACGAPTPTPRLAEASRVAGSTIMVKDTSIHATFAASGTAQPIRQATLSTKLMGTITEVLVKEGDVVAAGQPLVRIDARDLTAKQSQVSASIAEAEAMQRDATTQARRIRALYADSAATRAQLDAVETAVARADAGVRAAQAASAEVSAMTSYSVIRAPFAGVVTRRFVDPGAFAAPGAPLVAVQDASTLRITASATPEVARGLRRGQPLAATIEGQPVTASIEGVVPATAGNLYTINATVANRGMAILPGSAATLLLPLGERVAVVVPANAIVRQGDLTGVTLRTPTGDELRWIRLGTTMGDLIEVSAGLRPGDQIVVPTPSAKATLAEGN